MEKPSDIKLTRRAFLITGAGSVAAATLPADLAAQPAPPVLATSERHGGRDVSHVDLRRT
jgi:hypothetical protein